MISQNQYSTDYLNYRQKLWFQQASEREQKAFMLAGGIETRRSRDGQYGAFMNNVRIDEILYPSKAAAYEAAYNLLAELLKENLPLINFEELGLTSINRSLGTELTQKTIFDIHQIIHLAANLTNKSPGLKEFLQLSGEEAKNIFIDIAYPKDLATSFLQTWPSGFKSWMNQNDVFGFLVKAVMPRPKCPKYTSYDEARFSWEDQQTKWFYGETYQIAFNKVFIWAKHFWWSEE